MYYQYQSI